MSDPEEARSDDELELEAETVKDLDVTEQTGDEVRGGCSGSGTIPTSK